jgi:hypothetical protein
MKDNYGEVSINKLLDMNKQSTGSYAIKIDHRTMAIMFVFDAHDVYNVIIYTGSHFVRTKEECIEKIKERLDNLKGKKEINSIVYKNANQVLSIFANIGFAPRKEKDKYLILEYIK